MADPFVEALTFQTKYDKRRGRQSSVAKRINKQVRVQKVQNGQRSGGGKGKSDEGGASRTRSAIGITGSRPVPHPLLELVWPFGPDARDLGNEGDLHDGEHAKWIMSCDADNEAGSSSETESDGGSDGEVAERGRRGSLVEMLKLSQHSSDEQDDEDGYGGRTGGVNEKRKIKNGGGLRSVVAQSSSGEDGSQHVRMQAGAVAVSDMIRSSHGISVDGATVMPSAMATVVCQRYKERKASNAVSVLADCGPTADAWFKRLPRRVCDNVCTSFPKPTPIQAELLPHILAGKSVIGLAPTGSGKTLGYVLPILARLQHPRASPASDVARTGGARCVVIVPTRELAKQIQRTFCQVLAGVVHNGSHESVGRMAKRLGGKAHVEGDARWQVGLLESVFKRSVKRSRGGRREKQKRASKTGKASVIASDTGKDNVAVDVETDSASESESEDEFSTPRGRLDRHMPMASEGDDSDSEEGENESGTSGASDDDDDDDDDESKAEQDGSGGRNVHDTSADVGEFMLDAVIEYVDFTRKRYRGADAFFSSLDLDVLVTTPASLAKLIGGASGTSLKEAFNGCLRLVVLDEVDVLFGESLVQSVDEIFTALDGCDSPEESIQHVLVSATMLPTAEEIARTVLQDVVKICVGAVNTATKSVHQELVYAGDEDMKLQLLRHMVSSRGATRLVPPVLVFCQNKERCEQLYRCMRTMNNLHKVSSDNNGGRATYDASQGLLISVGRIHSAMSLSDRRHAVDSLRSGHYTMMIATDVVARGVDFPAVMSVVNYDVPLVRFFMRRPWGYTKMCVCVCVCACPGRPLLSFIVIHTRAIFLTYLCV